MMLSTKHSSQAMQPRPTWRRHSLVRVLLPILLMFGLSAFFLNSKSDDNDQGRTGIDKLLNEPVVKEPVVDELDVNEPMQEEQKGVNFLIPTDPVTNPSAKSAKAEGDSKSKGGKAKSKSTKSEKQDGKSKGAKGGSNSKKSKGGKAEAAKADEHDGKAGKGSAKAGKSKEKSDGGAKSEKRAAKATTEKIALHVMSEMEDEKVEAEFSIEDAE